MVKGLDVFKTHFSAFTDQYVLIGGTVTSELMRNAGLLFRTTNDLDIVILVEALTSEFIKAFWGFVNKGAYQDKYQNQSEKKYYRFKNPSNDRYPVCLELFSRIPDFIPFEGDGRYTPITKDTGMSPLSALLLDDEYYSFIKDARINYDGLSCISADHIIVLKAKAWLNNTDRKNSGEDVQSWDITKHRSDIFRLYQLLIPENGLELPISIKKDFVSYLNELETHPELHMKDYGIGSLTLTDVLSGLRRYYKI